MEHKYIYRHGDAHAAELMKVPATDDVVRFADMFAAMGTESRVRIMQQLLSAHPEGMVVGEIQAELGLSGSTLSHHLDKLRNEGLVSVQREGTFLRYRANTGALQELLAFLYSACCKDATAIDLARLVKPRR
jgi:DNA-binding transcriptional ArsR family regulator